MTPKQRELFDFIRSWNAGHGYPPSFREMATGLRCNVPNIHRLLHGLKDQGHVSITPRRKRSVQIVTPRLVQLNPEIASLTDQYARSHGISRETAANELLRAALEAA